MCVCNAQSIPFIILTVYVDDLILFTEDVTAMEELKNGLTNRFKMSDMGISHSRFVNVWFMATSKDIHRKALRKVWSSGSHSCLNAIGCECPVSQR